MTDSFDGQLWVSHTKQSFRLEGPHPLLDRRRYFLRLGQFPSGRWTGTDQDALYTSHDPEVSWEEAAQYHRSSLVGSDLADTNDRVVLQIVSFGPLLSPTIFDGRTEGMLSWPDLPRLMARREEGGHHAAQAAGRSLTMRASKLIVPSAPFYRAGDVRWNSVFIIGDGRIDEGYLPNRSAMRFGPKGDANKPLPRGFP